MLFTGNLLVYSQLTCDSSMYLGQAPNAASNTTLYGVNTSTNPFTYPAIGTVAAVKYNAMGFHPTSGYIYAMSDSTNNILRINSDGTYVNLGPVTNLPTGVSFNAGEIDSSGNFYVSGMGTVNTIYRINLTTLTATAIPLQSTITVSDFAFNPINNTLYGVHNSAGILTRINPANGAVVFIGTASAGAPFGAMMGSSTGAIYGVSNNGGFYQFNITNGTRVLISGSPASQGNDGAHCVTAPIAFSADLSITKTNGTTTYTPGTTTTYTVVVRNNGPFGVLNASVTDNVPAGIPNANMSYTAVASAGSTTAVTGTQTGAINDLVSLPVNGTVTYTVTVAIPLTFTGNLANTAAVIPPVTSSDSNLSNNIATDIDVLSSCLTGLDSDGDGIGDICDADADNDGIPNCIENGFNGDPNTAFKSNDNATAFTNASGSAPINQFRLTNGNNQQGQAWSYGKIDFAENFNITMKVLLSDADGIAMVFHNDPLGTAASGIQGQGLGARGIANGIALELDTFANSCTNDTNNGGNCDPNYDHGSIRTTAGTATSGWVKLAGDGQLGDGTVDDGLWHTVNVTWNATTRNLSYTFDGTAVTNYTFPTTGPNALETIFGGTSKVRFGFTGSTGAAGSNNSIGFDNPCEVPLYFDTDNDGIPDYLDLDSDNDGCPDAVEGGENVTASQLNPNGSINIGATGGINANGIPNLVNLGGAADVDLAAGQSIGYAQQSDINECNDIDNDGIPDIYDLDNDNDGILDSDECGSTNKINNGIFPTSGNNTNTVPGWTVGGTYSAIWPSGTGRVNLNSNGLEFRRDQATTTTLSQNLTGIMPASQISLNNLYWYRSPGTEFDQGFTFTVSYAGITYATISSTNAGAPIVSGSNGSVVSISSLPAVASQDQISAKTNLTIKLPLTSSIPTTGELLFTFVAGTSSDQVRDLGMASVTVFSCKDTDGDGIADMLDLDSDNDGCPDAVEGDENVNASQLNPNGSINVTANGGVDANGVPNLVNSGGAADIGGDQGQGVGVSQNALSNECQDIDNDGIPDYLDLDDDNDGILDVNEECNGFKAQMTTGSWIGTTPSNLTVSIPGATPRTNSGTDIILSQYPFHFNQNGADSRYNKAGNVSYTFTFSTPVPASEIAFGFGDLQSTASTFTVSVNGNSPNGTFVTAGGNGQPYYNIGTGTFTSPNNTAQNLLLMGATNTLVSNITIISTGVGSSDFVDFTFYGHKICDTDGDNIADKLDLDSDNDGCLDAIEGDENVTALQLVPAASGLSVGTGSTAANENLCTGTGCVDAQGVPAVVNSGGAADVGNDQGQGTGSSQNAAVNACNTACYKPFSLTGGSILDTKVGITSLSRAGSDDTDNWPMVRKGGWIALESKTKGLVLNRIRFNSSNQPVANDGVTLVITAPVEGMMVYDITNKCMKIYTLKEGDTSMAWHCLTAQTCPD